ncbi:MAG: ATP-binding protein [Phycisphaerae bacterium]
MLKRIIKPLLLRRLAEYPAAALLGSRQCGKTTLAQSLTGQYFDLEQQPDRLRLDLRWNQLISANQLIILDEAQTWPEIFPRLRGAIDQQPDRNGRFLLLGSVSPTLMVNVSESLAGRLSLLELTPFIWSETSSREAGEKLWFYGGYPNGGFLRATRYPQWQNDYLALLTQRDLPNWGLSAAPATTMRLLRMLAATQGQVWNASRIGQSLSLDYKTVNRYMNFLTGSFLIRMLEPYQANIRKRLVKSPKIYWRDTGLLHALLNTPDASSLIAQPWVGASWEGFVIEQLLAELSARGRQFHPFWFRSSDGYEIDLVLEMDGEKWAFEIKLTTAPGSADMRRLDKAADMIGASRRFLISQAPDSVGDKLRAACNLQWLLDRVIPTSH